MCIDAHPRSTHRCIHSCTGRDGWMDDSGGAGPGSTSPGQTSVPAGSRTYINTTRGAVLYYLTKGWEEEAAQLGWLADGCGEVESHSLPREEEGASIDRSTMTGSTIDYGRLDDRSVGRPVVDPVVSRVKVAAAEQTPLTHSLTHSLGLCPTRSFIHWAAAAPSLTHSLTNSLTGSSES
eukprot:GHVU01179234.1.p1 GENE.GHVU01179234.1~~GHVU01179234.1.p1  ORF type:complete len:179 (+),score=12.88 GHVU01179234.1:10-546(+)